MQKKFAKLRVLVIFSIVTLLVIAGCMSNKDLIGKFIVHGIGLGVHDWTSILEAKFNGLNTGLFETVENSDGNIEKGKVNFYVAPDGQLFINSSKNEVFEGILNKDGEIYMLSKADDPDKLTFQIAVKQISGMSNADLTGTYIVDEIGADSFDLPNHGHFTSKLEVEFDGKGNMIWFVLEDSYGRVGFGAGGTYEVADDGTTMVYPDYLPPLKVNIKPGGYVIAGVSTDAIEQPSLSLLVGIKKSIDIFSANISGNYIVHEYGLYQMNQLEHKSFSKQIDVEFDELGAVVWKTTKNSHGETSEKHGTYSINEDGLLTIQLDSGEIIKGTFNYNGRLLSILDSEPSDDDISISFAIKKDNIGRKKN